MVVATAIGLAGCTDETRQTHAACKLKAIELYPGKISSTEYEEEQAYYVKICMEAAGYEESNTNCGNVTARWMLPTCFQQY